MATLELAIDATKAQQGAQVAEQALKRVQTAAEGTTRSVSSAFQATGGSIQVAGGLAQAAKAFSELNVQAGLFNSSRLLLEIGKTAQDFREIANDIPKITRPILQTVDVFDDFGVKVGQTTQVVGTLTEKTTRMGTVFATLNSIVRANPLLAVATAIGGIASAMSLFGSETKKATTAYEELATVMSKARMDAQTAAYLGVPGPGGQGQMQALFNAVGQARATGTGMNLQQFGPMGYGATAARFLAQQGTPDQQRMALEYMRTGGFMQTRMETVPGLQMQRPVTERVQGLPSIQLDAAQTQAVLRGIYQSIQQEAPAAAAATNVYQFGAGELPTQMPTVGLPGGPLATAQYQYRDGQLRPEFAAGPGEAPYYLASPEAARVAELERQKVEASEQVAANFALAADYAGQLGSSVGAAFADVLMKTATLRQAFASIVASFARQGLADVGAAIFRGAVSGLTPTQAGANVGINQQPPA